jgi:hypothetical protein
MRATARFTQKETIRHGKDTEATGVFFCPIASRHNRYAIVLVDSSEEGSELHKQIKHKNRCCQAGDKGLVQTAADGVKLPGRFVDTRVKVEDIRFSRSAPVTQLSLVFAGFSRKRGESQGPPDKKGNRLRGRPPDRGRQT